MIVFTDYYELRRMFDLERDDWTASLHGGRTTTNVDGRVRLPPNRLVLRDPNSCGSAGASPSRPPYNPTPINPQTQAMEPPSARLAIIDQKSAHSVSTIATDPTEYLLRTMEGEVGTEATFLLNASRAGLF